MEEVMFSIIMCARNAESTIEKAIKSVCNQSFSDWELWILDNGSTDRTGIIINDIAGKDERIHTLRLEQGVGWAKGTSICLEYVKGQYMTFLAADDFLLNAGSLFSVAQVVEREEPDIIWTGYAMVQKNDQKYQIVGGYIPEYIIYSQKEDKISEVFELMNNLYYNSFFHYIKIDLLRQNGIDFYNPFLGDYEGMTEAMCVSSKSVVLDVLVYALTVNTSQTSGATTWRKNVVQWDSICKALVELGAYDAEKLRYIAVRIFNNNMAMLENIFSGGNVRDEEMNPIEKTELEKFQYLEQVLETSEFTEMFYYAGRSRYAERIFICAKNIYEQCLQEGYTRESINECVKWLSYLVDGLCEYTGDKFTDRLTFTEESFRNVKVALCHEKNIGIYGYELIERMIPFVTDEVLPEWNAIQCKFVEYYYNRIYELLFLAVEIKKKRKTKEVITIAKESMQLLQMIKDDLSAEQVEQTVSDIKLVADILE